MKSGVHNIAFWQGPPLRNNFALRTNQKNREILVPAIWGPGTTYGGITMSAGEQVWGHFVSITEYIIALQRVST